MKRCFSGVNDRQRRQFSHPEDARTPTVAILQRVSLTLTLM